MLTANVLSLPPRAFKTNPQSPISLSSPFGVAENSC
jgi:hypothetical protein